jgi:hypothetical protein
MGSAASSCTEEMVPSARTLCSCAPMRVSPPGSSTWVRSSWLETSPAVTPRAAMRSGSRSTRISRSTPPTRLTWPTPGTLEISRITFRSTNHDSSVSLRRSEATAKVSTASPTVVAREITGSLASMGRSGRMREMASRTSSMACDMSVPNWNSITVEELPVRTVEVMSSMPTILEIASSTLRVTSVSICVGGTPA